VNGITIGSCLLGRARSLSAAAKRRREVLQARKGYQALMR